MRLRELLRDCQYELCETGFRTCKDLLDIDISGIAYDSRKVDGNNIFVAIMGGHADGRNFINDAVIRGAVAVVHEKTVSAQSTTHGQPAVSKNLELQTQDSELLFIQVKDSRKALACLSNNFYQRPSENLSVIGVTGTNGKTTTTYLIRSILEEWHKETGLIGTISYCIKDREYPALYTTPESLEFQALLGEMLSSGCSHVVAEISSHALYQKRVDYTRFVAAAFTNLTRDHLDFHVTMENYYDAKRILFTELLSEAGTAVINVDDEWGRRLYTEIKDRLLPNQRIITCGINDEGADIKAEDIENSYSGISFTLMQEGKRGIEIESPLLGITNVYNILIAASVAKGLNMPDEAIRDGIKNVRAIKGRFEKIDIGQGFLCIIDYAHTPDALERLISTARTLVIGQKSAHIITVFGCGGDRDRGKRPLMGDIATRLSDYVIITSDNPRNEDPLGIIKEIESGISNKNYLIVPDRHEAISMAVKKAENGDIVLIAGKGHEDYQEIKGKRHLFSDREIAEEALRNNRLQGD